MKCANFKDKVCDFLNGVYLFVEKYERLRLEPLRVKLLQLRGFVYRRLIFRQIDKCTVVKVDKSVSITNQDILK
jgi:hypothetical protein